MPYTVVQALRAANSSSAGESAKGELGKPYHRHSRISERQKARYRQECKEKKILFLKKKTSGL
jgi:hypothetical protein